MANIPQWKVGDILSASKLNDMVDAINNLLADQTGNNDAYITLDELNNILKQYSDVGHTHSVEEIANLVLPTKLSQLQNDTSYVTEDYVTNAIANAQLGGDGEVDLSAYATKNYVDNEIDKIELTPGPQGEQGPKGEDGLTTSITVNGSTFVHQNGVITLPDYPEVNSSIDTYTKEEIDDIVNDYTGGKKQVYLTQAEYDALNNDDKNDETKVYNIIDAEEENDLTNYYTKEEVDAIIARLEALINSGGSSDSNPVEPTLSSISAIYTQGETIIYPDSSLDDLKQSLVVTANYSDGTSNNITDYELSGKLTIGTSIITVSFEDKTAKFNVEVSSNSQPPVEPVSYTNYIYNEDTFTNPAQGTTPSASTYYYVNTNDTGTEVIAPGVLKIFNKVEGKNAGLMVRHGKGDNQIYYIQFKVKSEAAINAGSPQKTILKSDVPLEDWTMVSFIYTDTSATMHSIKLTLNNNGAIPGVAYIKELMRINLTEIYGAGKEPSDVSACDKIFATFVPGLRG